MRDEMSCVVPIDRIPQICQRRGRHDDAKLLSIRNELTLVHTLLAIFFAWMCYRMASTGQTNGKIRGKMNSLKPPTTKQESKRMRLICYQASATDHDARFVPQRRV